MQQIIDGVGEVSLTPSSDYFATLVDTIVGQMISIKAADTIYARIVDAVGGVVSPESILALETDVLRGCGLSGRKTIYIQSLAERCISGELDLAAFDSMEDAEVKRALCSLHGIGAWSAEMFLMFSLGRENVFSAGDGGLVRALRDVYGVDAADKKAVKACTDRWSPYNSVAALYLWKTLGNE